MLRVPTPVTEFSGCERELQPLSGRKSYLLGPHASSDVLDYADEGFSLPVVVPEKRDSRAAPDRTAVLAQITLLQHVVRDLPGQQTTNVVLGLRNIVGMSDLGEGQRAQFIG